MSSLATELARTLTLDVPYNTSLVLRSVAVLGAASGTLGVFLLLRKRSLTADALAHAALPGVCVGFLVASYLELDARSLGILLPAAALVGLLGIACIHALNAIPRIREDASIGIVLSVFFAFGIVLLSVIQNMPAGQRAGLHHFIFGQAATMSANDSRLIMVVAVLVLAASIGLFKEMRLLCFDAAFAKGIGFSSNLLDGMLMVLVTVVTVIGLHAVGALLMVALLIIPAAAARFWTDRLGPMVVVSAALGAGGAYVGAAVSAVAERTPTGPAIVISCGVLFTISLLCAPQRGLIPAAVRRWIMERKIERQHLLRAMFERGEIAGNFTTPVTIENLHERRSWTFAHLRRLLTRSMRQGELAAVNSGYILTQRGQDAAARIVRTHRLWEHYLTTHADVAPGHVDRAVEDIEHVLGEDIVVELERELAANTTLTPMPMLSSEGASVPESLHELNERERTS